MDDQRNRHFILQQGFGAPAPGGCSARYSALQFQPRIVALVVVAGAALQDPTIFLALSAVLWWSALLPHWNPFEALYHVTLGARPGAVRLTPAPPPRRFAQGMAGAFALAIGGALLLDWWLAAFVLEAVLGAAILALIVPGFCLGSFVFHLLRGRTAFALRTSPWARRGA